MGSFYNHFILVLLLLALLTPISSFAGFSKLTAKKAAPLKPKAMWDRYLRWANPLRKALLHSTKVYTHYFTKQLSWHFHLASLSLTKVPLAGDVKVANVAVQFENKVRSNGQESCNHTIPFCYAQTNHPTLQWYRTGSVCFQSACSLDYALMRSKRLVAEHARRLYPVEIPKVSERAKSSIPFHSIPFHTHTKLTFFQDYEASLGVNFENLSKGETTVNWEQFSSQISKEVFEEVSERSEAESTSH